MPLDQDVNFHPHGRQVRACKNCWLQWVKWAEKRYLPTSTIPKSLEDIISTQEDDKLPTLPINVHSISPNSFDAKNISFSSSITAVENGSEFVPGLDQTCQSVPLDWHWSTF